MYNPNSNHPYFYTQEQLKWIAYNKDLHINSVSLCKAFNERFSKNKKPSSIKSVVRRKFPNHEWPWSGGQKKGEGVSVTAAPVGSERFSGGYWYVKVDNKSLPKNFTTKEVRENWVQKHRYIWEQAYGKLGNKQIVLFLDGDRSNFSLDNLYPIERRVSVYMMRNKMFFSDPNLTLAAVKLAELRFALGHANTQ